MASNEDFGDGESRDEQSSEYPKTQQPTGRSQIEEVYTDEFVPESFR
jgi:hypothetical protein